MKIGIIGSRTFTDYEKLKNTMSFFDLRLYETVTIVSGGAKGADTLAEQYAKDYGYLTEVYPADWDTYGKRAGYLRNITIVENSDVIVAYWDGKSKGTCHSLKLARDMKKPSFIIYI